MRRSICGSELTMVFLNRSADPPAVGGSRWYQVISGALDNHEMEEVKTVNVTCGTLAVGFSQVGVQDSVTVNSPKFSQRRLITFRNRAEIGSLSGADDSGFLLHRKAVTKHSHWGQTPGWRYAAGQTAASGSGRAAQTVAGRADRSWPAGSETLHTITWAL